MPLAMASRGESKIERPAVEQIVPSSGLVEPVEDVHQRRLAGAVFAEDRMDAPFATSMTDVVERLELAERLGHAFDGDVGHGRRGGPVISGDEGQTASRRKGRGALRAGAAALEHVSEKCAHFSEENHAPVLDWSIFHTAK